MSGELDPQPAFMADLRQNAMEPLDITGILKGIAVVVPIIVHEGIGWIQGLHVFQSIHRRIEELDAGINKQYFQPLLLQRGQRHGWFVLQRCGEILSEEWPGLTLQGLGDGENGFRKALFPDG